MFRGGKGIFLAWRRLPVYLIFLILAFLQAEPAAAFDPDIVKPVAPNGIIETFGTQSLQTNSFAMGVDLEYARHETYYLSNFGFAYGITNRIEFTLNVPYVYNLEANPPANFSGVEDVGAALKYRFLDQEGSYSPSAAVLLMGYLPTGNGILSRGGGAGTGLVLSRRVGPFMGNLNGIYTIPGNPGLKDEWDVLAGLDFSAANNLKMLGELQIRKGPYSNRVDQAEGRIGFRVFTEHFYSTVALGYDFKERDPQFRVLISLTAVSGKPR